MEMVLGSEEKSNGCCAGWKELRKMEVMRFVFAGLFSWRSGAARLRVLFLTRRRRMVVVKVAGGVFAWKNLPTVMEKPVHAMMKGCDGRMMTRWNGDL